MTSREQRFGLAVADGAIAVARLDLLDRGVVAERAEERDQRAVVGVLGLLGRRGVRDDPPDRVLDDIPVGHEGDGVAVGLAHLAAVEPGKRRDAFGDERPRFPQPVASVHARELLREVDGDLQVLCLVGPDGHLVGVEAEDVGGHQDRIAVQAHVDAVIWISARFGVGGDRRLVGVRAVEQALGGHVAQQGREPRDRRHPALAVHVHVGAIEPARQQCGGQPLRPIGQRGRIGMAVERVQVGDEHMDVPVLVGGKASQGPDRAGVVAQVQLSGRLEARQGRDAAVGGGRVRGHGDLLVVGAPGSRTGASEVTVDARWPAPSGVGPELRPELRTRSESACRLAAGPPRRRALRRGGAGDAVQRLGHGD